MANNLGVSGFNVVTGMPTLSKNELAFAYSPETAILGSLGIGNVGGETPETTDEGATEQQQAFHPLWGMAEARKQDFYQNRAPRMMHYLRDSSAKMDEQLGGGRCAGMGYYPDMVQYHPDAVDYGWGTRQFTPETVGKPNPQSLVKQSNLSPQTQSGYPIETEMAKAEDAKRKMEAQAKSKGMPQPTTGGDD